MSEAEQESLSFWRYLGSVVGFVSVLFITASGVGIGGSLALGRVSFFDFLISTTLPSLAGVALLVTAVIVPGVLNRGFYSRSVIWTFPLIYLSWMFVIFVIVIASPSGPMTSLIVDPALVWRNWWAWVGVLIGGWVMMRIFAGNGRGHVDEATVE